MEAFIGTILPWPVPFAPVGWAFCQGQMLSIQQNSALFALLGTAYGGDGRSTFGLPDLRSRVPVGAGQGTGLSNYNLGQQSGAENVTLTTAQMPAHNHGLLANATNGDQDSPVGNYLAQTYDGNNSTSFQTYSTSSSGAMNQGAIQQNGGNQGHPNIQPVLGLNYIICLQGIFPSRP